MRKLNFQSQVLPHIIAVLIFYALTAFYFSDVVFKDEVLKQGDTMQWSGAAGNIYAHRAQYGEEPLWSPNAFSGMPTFTISTIYNGDLMEYIDAVFRGGLPYPVAIVFMGLVAYYITLLCFGLNSYLAIVGAIAFAFFSFNFVSLEAGHNSKVRAMMLAPMILGGFHLLLNKRYLWGFIVAAIGTALQIKAGHYQITYYTGMLIAFYIIAELIYAIISKTIINYFIAGSLLAVAGIIGLGTNLGRLWTVQEYTQYSMRGKAELTPKDASKPTDGGLDRDYVFSWSHERWEVLTLLIPTIRGGSSQEPTIKKGSIDKALRDQGGSISDFPAAPYYWGQMPFTSGPIYAGAIIVFLFVLGCFIVEPRLRWWLLGATIFGLLLSMGRFFESFNYFMYDHFPYYAKFRTVTMAIYIAQVCMPLMAMLAVQKLLSKPFSKEMQQQLIYAVAGTAGLCLIIAIVPSLVGDFTNAADKKNGMPDWIIPALEADRASLVASGAWQSFFFIIIAAGLLWIGLKGILKPLYVTIILAVLVTVDMWTLDRRYLNKENFKKKTDIAQEQEPEDADKYILEDKEYYRVLNLDNPFAETKTSSVHHSLGGYSPAKIRRYQDLIENDLTDEIQGVIGMLQKGTMTIEGLKAFPVINMLNTRYLKYDSKKEGVIRNPYACGPAWFVNTIKPVSSPDEDIQNLKGLDVVHVAIVDTKKFPDVKPAQYNTTGASVKMTQTKANDLIYETYNPNAGLLVMSEIYYPAGWTATVDDKETPIIRADYALRGIVLPAGKHKVELKFEPQSYFLGNKIMAISSLLLMGISALALVLTFKKEKE